MFGKLKSKLFSWVIIVLESLSQLPKILWSGDALLECMDLYEAEWTNSALDRTLSPLRKWIHWGPISATATIIMIGLSASILHVSWWDISTVGGFLDLLVFLTWNYLVLVNLNAACRLGAGYIKLGWHPKDSREWELLRYCHRCNGFKVPRSHHCSRCDRCVLLLDHHCPWINNCVGHRNQFAFIRFLFSAVVGCLHAAIILTSCLYQVLTFIIHEPSTPRERHLYEPPNLPITSVWLFIFAVLSVGMAYGVILAVGILLFIQLRSVSENTTGIERLFPCNNGHFIQPEENNGQNGIYEKAKDT